MKSYVCVFSVVFLLCASTGCDEGYTSPEVEPECVDNDDGTATGCAASQICLQSRCYEQCTSDLECSRWEQCVAGLCARSSQPKDDGGISPDGDADTDTDTDTDVDSDADSGLDSDTPDADDGGSTDCTSCADPTPYCHALGGVCVECIDFGQCTSAPLCDIAFGDCIGSATGQCAPCDSRFGCSGGEICTDRRPGFHEVVCLQDCTSSSCASGTTCTGGVCVPTFGGSCTAWFANRWNRTCSERDDCRPRGSGESNVDCTPEGRCAITCTGDDARCPPTTSCDGTHCVSM